MTASSLPPSLPEGRPLLSRLRESRSGRLCLDLGMMAGGKTWPWLWALSRLRRRRPSIKRLRVQPRSLSYIHSGSWWMTISHGFLIISKEAKGKRWGSSNTGRLVVLVNSCLRYKPDLFYRTGCYGRAFYLIDTLWKFQFGKSSHRAVLSLTYCNKGLNFK